MAARKIVLVTGGNNGLGYETVKALVKSDKPYHVLLGSRSIDKGTQAVKSIRDSCPQATNTVEEIQVDLTSDESIQAAFDKVKSGTGRLDVLVNNAAASFDPAFMRGQVTLRECFAKSYDVNVAGTNVLTWTFMPLLLKSADPRLIFVSGLSYINRASEAYFPTPPLPAGWPKELTFEKIGFETIGYRCSKTALNMLMLDWNHKLKADGVKVWGVLPGMLTTDLGAIRDIVTDMPGLHHPSHGAEFVQRVVEGERDADTGKLVSRKGIESW